MRCQLSARCLWCVAMLAAMVSPAGAQGFRPIADPQFSGETSGRRWAILIGVGNYASQPKLRLTVNDVRLMENALVVSSFDRDRILVLADDREPNMQPSSQNLERQIPRWLKNVGSEDVIFVYFSGHGAMDDSGAGYLCPSDYDHESPERTGFRISKLRELLVNCPARQKVLVLDCCHAGTDKAVGLRRRSTSHKLLEPLESKSPGLVTLASCQGEEQSYEDADRGHGVFTWHLAQALRGRADRNQDGFVDSEELHSWCLERVSIDVQRRHNADQHPVLHPEVSEPLKILRTQFSPSVDELMERKENVALAVLTLRDGEWVVRGSAFPISQLKNKLYVATAASVVEDESGRPLPVTKLRATSKKVALLSNPSQIFRHSEREQGRGPDVAILEFDWGAAASLPTMFNLKLPSEQLDLRGRPCALLGFPSWLKLDAMGRPNYAEGRFASHLDGQGTLDRLIYSAPFQYQSEGAPVFVIEDDSRGGGQLREVVVGLTCGDRFGDSKRAAVPIEFLWQVIETAAPKLGYSIIPLPLRSKAETKPVVKNIPNERPEQSSDSAPVLPNWPQRIDRELKVASQQGRTQNWDRGVTLLTDLESEIRRVGTNQDIPWELFCLRGVLLAHQGFRSNSANDRHTALEYFRKAHLDASRAYALEPRELFPMFMLARLANNLGTPNPGQALRNDELAQLRWTHDTMQKLIENHENGNRKLTNLELAQAWYLLGYAHNVAGGRLCKSPDGLKNFQASWKAMHSTQVARFLNTQANDAVDLWDEYEVLLVAWDRRSSTRCEKCQQVARCEACQ
ncbi:MAG: caspase family protein [Planctomycetaceae bacterium]